MTKVQRQMPLHSNYQPLMFPAVLPKIYHNKMP
nr:MAG TPA: hypothetical protein [Caudoviricetes sp.]